MLRSARRQRECYVGSWMPDIDSDPVRRLEMDGTVSIALIAALERLSPRGRAVFLSREVFEYDCSSIADILDRSVQGCRQSLIRARRPIISDRPRFDETLEHRDEIAAAFFDSLAGGDLATLESRLAEDAVFTADGGGLPPAVRVPVRDAKQVARFLLGLMRQGDRRGSRTSCLPSEWSVPGTHPRLRRGNVRRNLPAR